MSSRGCNPRCKRGNRYRPRRGRTTHDNGLVRPLRGRNPFIVPIRGLPPTAIHILPLRGIKHAAKLLNSTAVTLAWPAPSFWAASEHTSAKKPDSMPHVTSVADARQHSRRVTRKKVREIMKPLAFPAAPLESTPERTQVGAPVTSTAVSHAGDELLTKHELAARLKKTPRCIEQWMRRRYLPYIKIAHTVRFSGTTSSKPWND